MAEESKNASRRKPAQRRSRERFELILQAAAVVIQRQGVNQLTPATLSQEASMPTSTIYQYFENTDAVLRTYIDSEFERVALAIAESVMALERVSLRTLFGATAYAHLEYFRSHPVMIPLWMEGRSNPVVLETISLHCGRLARFLDSASRKADLIKPETPIWAAEIASHGFDRIFELVFSEQRSKREQEEMTDAFLAMIVNHAETNYSTERGLKGIPASEFIAALGGEKVVEPADFWAGLPKR